MLRRVRANVAALVFASTFAWGMVLGTACSVDRAGLASNDGSTSTGGSSGGTVATGGHPGGASGHGGASGSSGATGGAGGVAVSGEGGTSEQAGGAGGGAQQTGGAGGSGQTGGVGGDASGGSTGTGGVDAGVVTGSGGLTGSGGEAGSAADAGGAVDATGAGGSTGTGGETGTGGATGTGGVTGTGGAAGSGGGTGGAGGSPPPSCAGFPAGSSFVTPTDGLLHCYWVHTEMTDWNTAEGQCTGERGSLATILSSEENMFVFQILLQAKAFIMNGVSLGATDGKQIDDKTGPGQYAWVTGEPWGYTNWHSGQPDGSCTCTLMQTCMCDHTLVMTNDGTWYDRPQTTVRPYVCEAVAR